MKNQEIADLILDVRDRLSTTDGFNRITEVVMPLRQIASPRLHEGCGEQMGGSAEGYRMKMEWFAGQLLDIVDHEKWFAVNSWINCAEKFTKDPA